MIGHFLLCAINSEKLGDKNGIGWYRLVYTAYFFNLMLHCFQKAMTALLSLLPRFLSQLTLLVLPHGSVWNIIRSQSSPKTWGDTQNCNGVKVHRMGLVPNNLC